MERYLMAVRCRFLIFLREVTPFNESLHFSKKNAQKGFRCFIWVSLCEMEWNQFQPSKVIWCFIYPLNHRKKN